VSASPVFVAAKTTTRTRECAAFGCTAHPEYLHLQREWCKKHLPMIETSRAFVGCGCGPGPCEWCALHVRSGLRVVVVGERFNLGGRTHDPAVWDLRLGVTEPPLGGDPPSSAPRRRTPDEAAEWLIRLGAFRLGVSRCRLLKTGLRWDAALNLLEAQRCGEWTVRDASRATTIAARIRPTLLARFDRVVLLGKRVQAAFVRDHAASPGYWPVGDDANFVHLPHPSPRSRAWNAPDALAACRDVVSEASRPA
jgi:hypothetical protein